MKKEDLTNQILVAILRALHTQNEILVDALSDRIGAKEEITRLMSADLEVEHLLTEALDHE